METWDIYDRNRQRTGRTMLRGEPLADGDYHLVVNIWIANDDGEVLLQKRSMQKRAGAGLWSCTGGAAIAGEDSAKACQREMTEELGVAPDMERAVMVMRDTMGGCHKEIWLIHQNIAMEEFHLQAEEVDEVKWVTLRELEWMMDKPEMFWHLQYMDKMLPILHKREHSEGKQYEKNI